MIIRYALMVRQHCICGAKIVPAGRIAMETLARTGGKRCLLRQANGRLRASWAGFELAGRAGACRQRCRAPWLETASPFDGLPEAACAVAEAHGARQAPPADAAFESGEIDAALIASVTSTFADYIRQAVAAPIIANDGKNAVCMRRAEPRPYSA